MNEQFNTPTMKSNKAVFFLILSALITVHGTSQKLITDGSILYNVSVVNGKDQPGIADAFDGATLLVSMKSSQVRSDLKSNVRLQSTFFNAKDGTAVILKESGNEKYMINLTAAQWNQYNRKYSGVKFNYTDETKTIAGYPCKKAVSNKLSDGSSITVYYATDLKPLSPGYEYAFKDLPGVPLEYEISTGAITVRYLASTIQMTPLNASHFDLPKSGYKLLDYKQ